MVNKEVETLTTSESGSKENVMVEMSVVMDDLRRQNKLLRITSYISNNVSKGLSLIILLASTKCVILTNMFASIMTRWMIS